MIEVKVSKGVFEVVYECATEQEAEDWVWAHVGTGARVDVSVKWGGEEK